MMMNVEHFFFSKRCIAYEFDRRNVKWCGVRHFIQYKFILFIEFPSTSRQFPCWNLVEHLSSQRALYFQKKTKRK